MGFLHSYLQTGIYTIPQRRESKSFILSVQEPPTRENNVVGLDTRHNLLFDRTKKTRAAIYASRNINLWLLPEFTGEDMVTALWRKVLGDSEGNLVIVFLYLDINSCEVVLALLGRLLRQADARQQEVIIYADTNAHSSFWKSSETNRRGEALEEFILLHNLVVLNNGNHFTFFNRRSATIIDVTPATPGIEGQIKEWRVMNEVQGSDHLLITHQLTVSENEVPYVRNWNLGDWSHFQESMEKSTPAKRNVWSEVKVEQDSMDLLRKIQERLNWTHPLRPVRTTIQNQSWWNSELTRLKKAVKISFSMFRHTN